MEPRSEQAKSIREIQVSGSTSKKSKDLIIEGYPVGGLSIGGHETCIIFPTLKVAFDISRCPPCAVSQDFLFISHSLMDHIGGLPMYVASRGLYGMKPPTIVVPKCIKEDVEQLFEGVHRKMDHSELNHILIGLDVGEEFYLRKDLKVKAFRTYHVIPSQISYTLTEPDIAFTGETTSDFLVDESNIDVLQCTFVNNSITLEHARE